MNKEDVLKILEGAKDKNSDVPMRLVRLAFEKLPEPCMDTISRQDAIEAVQNRRMMLSKEKVLLINDLKKLPLAEPKRGKWIYAEDSMADCVDGYRCDQCGFFVPWDYQHKSIDYIKDYNFCPNCGSYNGGEQDG